ncbi:bacteriohemerythrin [Tepidiphilus olei]|uniref:bacteriohemerythrin n=1 Tax=Tepidiphilus olei TaxID=2502184 RepID=UPI00115DF96B|nr:hemerythrin family protein [Tepidiphilus olei]
MSDHSFPFSSFHLQWRDELSVHNDAIDRDHRWLIELVDRIQSLILKRASLARLTIALDELARYTEEHFTREELIQQAAGYPDLDEHRRSHEKLERQLTDITARILAQPVERTTLDALDDNTRRALLDLLRSWLIDHIIREDLQLRPWLERFPRDWNPASPPSCPPQKEPSTTASG